jgi:hypothetical protein
MLERLHQACERRLVPAVFDDFLELGVITHTRDTNDGHSALYQLNEASEIADFLYKLDEVVLSELIEEENQPISN